MITLLDSINRLRDFFDRHLQINTVNVTLDDSVYNAIRDVIYPVVNIQYLNTDTDDYMNRNFKIIIASRSDSNINGIDLEILSDCELIASDFFSWLDFNNDFDWTRTSSLRPFEEGTLDRTTGFEFTITVLDIRGNCIDDIPLSRGVVFTNEFDYTFS